MAVLTAAKADQFAGSLPGTKRPAFSYLVLGGLRGWAAEGKKAALTAGDLWEHPTGSFRVLRGGSWCLDVARHFRAAFRIYNDPSCRDDGIGFRPAR
ncbi:MAG: SUMF1/EgtB/PvdO family nonheme iron enzyme [Elusimicrobiota bacterium]|jgi:hypothetical protein